MATGKADQVGADQVGADQVGADQVGAAVAPAGLGWDAPVERAALFSCSLLPPLGVALYDPSLFFAALDNAGTFGILVLFGMVPAAMAWQSRYGGGDDGAGENAAPEMLPGGRFTLGAMGAAAAAIVALVSYERLSL